MGEGDYSRTTRFCKMVTMALAKVGLISVLAAVLALLVLALEAAWLVAALVEAMDTQVAV